MDVNRNGTVKKSPFPHPYSVFSIRPDGTGFKVISRGLRQPWQLTFVGTSPNPYVSVLSQDAGKIPNDAIVVAKPRTNYGFPNCFAGVGIACAHTKFAKPLITLPQHASPMGIQAVGRTLYVALFGGIGKSGPEVVTIPAKKGGKPKPFLKGFAAPVVAVGIWGGMLYAGDLTGTVYSVAL
jgi:glucose/arabinose dehydrogenase